MPIKYMVKINFSQIAQMVEHLAVNEDVLGSNPSLGGLFL